MYRLLRQFGEDERGATALEYGVIVAVMGLGIVTALQNFPTQINATLAAIASYLQ